MAKALSASISITMTLGIGTPAAIDISSTTLKSCGASAFSIGLASAIASTMRLPKASEIPLQIDARRRP